MSAFVLLLAAVICKKRFISSSQFVICVLLILLPVARCHWPVCTDIQQVDAGSVAAQEGV